MIIANKKLYDLITIVEKCTQKCLNIKLKTLYTSIFIFMIIFLFNNYLYIKVYYW